MPIDTGARGRGRRIGPTHVNVRTPNRSAGAPAYQQHIRPSNISASPSSERQYTAAYNTLSRAPSTTLGAGLPSGVTPTILSDVLDAAKHYNVDPALLLGQEQTESGFNPANYNRRNYAGAGGISQFIPSTGATYGVRLGTDPASLRTQIRVRPTT